MNAFEVEGFDMMAMEMRVPSMEKSVEHYAEHKGKEFFNNIVDFLTGKRVIVAVFYLIITLMFLLLF